MLRVKTPNLYHHGVYEIVMFDRFPKHILNLEEKEALKDLLSALW